MGLWNPHSGPQRDGVSLREKELTPKHVSKKSLFWPAKPFGCTLEADSNNLVQRHRVLG